MLKPQTERVWTFLKAQPSLAGFVLVGGSALALHLRHRLSEDLDFVYPDDRLPRSRLDTLRRNASEAGIELEPHDDPGALNEFTQGGLDLLAMQSVKVSFFAPDRSVIVVLEKQPAAVLPRLATLDELFRSKCLLSAKRSRTRDWFDLYVLMKRRGYSLNDYHEAFRVAGLPDQADIGLQRLCSGTPSAADEGFEQLAPEPSNVAELQQFFQTQRDAFERSKAAQAWRKAHD
jgi:hypothetical protein